MIDILCSRDPALALREWTSTNERSIQIPPEELNCWETGRNRALESTDPTERRLFLFLSLIWFGSVPQVERALNKWKYADVINKVSRDKETALTLASRTNKAEIVDLLCQHGADVDYAGIDGWTALHLASSHGFPRVVEKLLGHGASIGRKSEYGHTPLAVVRRAPRDKTKKQGRKEVRSLLKARMRQQ